MPFTDFGYGDYSADNANRLDTSALLSGADAYFHPNRDLRSETWKKYAATQRAALIQALRELELTQGRIMETPADSSELGPRDDYAVYEQAFFLLEELPRIRGKSGGGGKRSSVTLSRRGKRAATMLDMNGVLISPMAQRWLGRNRLKIVRA